MVRDFAAVGNIIQIKKLLKILGQDFSMSNNPNTRKGGLIGLAAAAIALGKETSDYIDEMIKPMLSCCCDQDSRVRYYACEALYNLIKVARGSSLKHFNHIFDSLSKMTADPDQSVKNGAELLDRLMKDIVTESSAFNLVEFIPLLREKMYTRNQFAKQFVVSWISLLDNVPDIDMVIFLPELLDGLFEILSDPTMEIRKMCETVLNELLMKIIRNPEKADFSAMIKILITQAQSLKDEVVQYTALVWLKELMNLAPRKSILPDSAGILTAILPCLAVSCDKEENESRATVFSNNINIREVAKALNFSLMQLVTMDEQRSQQQDLQDSMNVEENVNSESRNEKCGCDFGSVLKVLTTELKMGENASTQTKLAVLRWIDFLYSKVPHKIMPHLDDDEDDLFPVMLKTLSDHSDEVVVEDVEVLAHIFKSSCFTNSSDIDLRDQMPANYFTKFMSNLLDQFHRNENLMKKRGSFIIRQLCLLINAEDIYRSFSELLLNYNQLEFAYNTVHMLNKILLTNSELYQLRVQLRDLKTDESCSLFCCLYKTWCHSPVATVSLCLLTKNYKHACDLIMMFGDLDLTVEFLNEIDQLVQLIESPIFACKLKFEWIFKIEIRMNFLYLNLNELSVFKRIII